MPLIIVAAGESGDRTWLAGCRSKIHLSCEVSVPTELLSAVEIARDFLTKAGHKFVTLENAHFNEEENRWSLIFNVGIAVKNLKSVVIDGATEKVVGLYDASESTF